MKCPDCGELLKKVGEDYVCSDCEAVFIIILVRIPDYSLIDPNPNEPYP